MTQMKMDGLSGADAAPNQSRREALKKFGRYAAAAPAVMVLLDPLEGHAAGKGKGKGKGGGGY